MRKSILILFVITFSKLVFGQKINNPKERDSSEYKNIRKHYSKKDSIVFLPKITCFKLYDNHGKIILNECKSSFCITRFKKGLYWLVIDKEYIELGWY